MTTMPEQFPQGHRIPCGPNIFWGLIDGLFSLSATRARGSGIPPIEHPEIILCPELCPPHREALQREKSEEHPERAF